MACRGGKPFTTQASCSLPQSVWILFCSACEAPLKAVEWSTPGRKNEREGRLMAENNELTTVAARQSGILEEPLPRWTEEGFGISAEEFQESFGEDIRRTLDLDTWRVGSDWSQEQRRIEREVREAVERENTLQKQIRPVIFPRLQNLPQPPKNPGKTHTD